MARADKHTDGYNNAKQRYWDVHYDGMQEYLENRDDAECNEEVPMDPIL